MLLAECRNGSLIPALLNAFFTSHPHGPDPLTVLATKAVDHALNDIARFPDPEEKPASHGLETFLEVPNRLCYELCAVRTSSPDLAHGTPCLRVRRSGTVIFEKARDFNLLSRKNIDGEQMREAVVLVARQMVKDGVVRQAQVVAQYVDENRWRRLGGHDARENRALSSRKYVNPSCNWLNASTMRGAQVFDMANALVDVVKPEFGTQLINYKAGGGEGLGSLLEEMLCEYRGRSEDETYLLNSRDK